MSKKPPPRVAASQSFTEPEVEALDLILKNIMRDGGDLRVLRKSAAVVNLARKVLAMRGSIERQKLKRATVTRADDDAGDSDWDADQDARDGLPDVGDK